MHHPFRYYAAADDPLRSPRSECAGTLWTRSEHSATLPQRVSVQRRGRVMTPVIAFFNQKGGTAKTTSTLNVGAALAERGYRVLALDLDPQASLTMALGVDV
ncbi:MAG: ParA family protein, partial [Thermomicrobium sp.]|nr:ParA family protein [Thermomicrobium sp.]